MEYIFGEYSGIEDEWYFDGYRFIFCNDFFDKSMCMFEIFLSEGIMEKL